ncbi:MAG TPA: glycosyltransferase family 39 protein, partial [Polyangiaceae bacterium]|nr:glycosyltransferase family 39 protein [Polyangiaceae bacterium]
WLLATARSLGFPRDEGFYFRAAHDYAGWWRLLLERGHDALSQGAIDAAWSNNHEHPALMKTLFGISGWLLHDSWRVFSDASTAMRFPTMCMAGVALWTTYLFGARLWSRRAGAVAAALLGLMPRVFFHAHLACFDVAIMTMWLLCIYAAWRAQETGRLRWAIATGVLFGLALETKHNAWILPLVIVPHAFFVQRRAFWQGLRAGRVSVPASVVSMAVLGPAVFLALWPYLWNDTMARIQWYVEFHLNHEYYNIEFLGKNYFGPPSPPSYLPVMIAATVPSVTLALFAVGAFDRASAGLARILPWRSQPPADRGEADVLMALSFCAAVAPFFLPRTPIFGGTKHWLPAYPILALWAGRGLDLVVGAARRALASLAPSKLAAAEAALVATVVLAPLAITAHSHPFGLSAYVPLVGGTAGGADLGLNRQFWGYTSQDAAAEYVDRHAPPGASVFIHDTAWDSWAHMQDEGRVRADLRAVGAPSEAQIALVMHELHMNEVDYSVWVAFGTVAPKYIVEHDGVPIVSVYQR